MRLRLRHDGIWALAIEDEEVRGISPQTEQTGEFHEDSHEDWRSRPEEVALRSDPRVQWSVARRVRVPRVKTATPRRVRVKRTGRARRVGSALEGAARATADVHARAWSPAIRADGPGPRVKPPAIRATGSARDSRARPTKARRRTANDEGDGGRRTTKARWRAAQSRGKDPKKKLDRGWIRWG
jgi:hypothetical protein